MTAAVPFDARTTEILHQYGFDEGVFAELRARLRRGEFSAGANAVRGRIEPDAPESTCSLVGLSAEERNRLIGLGEEALRQGRVGVVILAGGMATRFGGVVKADVEAFDGRSFLDVKLRDVEQVRKRFGAKVPAFLMTSFATDAAMRERVLGRAMVETFPQFVSVRLTPSAEIFFDSAGCASLYAPGHGDLSFALRRSGILERFRGVGGEVLLMSNVDNIAATLDPAIVGAHLDRKAAVTVEVVDKLPGDRGGAPARVDGKAQIVEAFRFPVSFDQDKIAVFNTNTLVFDAKAIDRDFPMTWFAVRKSVDSKPTVQFERLVGELTAFLPTTFLHVERTGSGSRFLPVKDPEELAARRDEIRAVARDRNLL